MIKNTLLSLIAIASATASFADLSNVKEFSSAKKFFDLKNFDAVALDSNYGKKPSNIAVPTGAKDFTVERPKNAKKPVVFAIDFGVNAENEDCAAAINKAIEYCKKIDAGKLILPNGKLKCFGDKGIMVDGLTDFEIEGSGSTLVFYRPSKKEILPQYTVDMPAANILVRNCTRVKLTNFKMDWDWERDPLASMVKAVNKHLDKDGNGSYIDVEFLHYKKHPFYNTYTPLTVFMPMKDGMWYEKCWSMHFGTAEGHWGTKHEWLSENRLRIYPYVKSHRAPKVDMYEHKYNQKSNYYNVNSVPIGQTFRLSHYYYGKNGINLDSNKNTVLEDIDIYSCRGMGLQILGYNKYLEAKNFNFVRPKDSPKRVITSTADAVHVVNSQGHIKFINCKIEFNQDDYFNFHDRTSFGKKIADNKIEITNERGIEYFLAKEGETIELFYGNAEKSAFTAKILKIEGQILTLDKTIPEQKGLGFLLASLAYATDNVILKDCDFTNSFGRCLVYGKNYTIENCKFYNTSGTPLRFQFVYTADKWSEGYGCDNVVVKNCQFENTSIRASQLNGFTNELFCGGRIDKKSGFDKTSKSVAKNILIEDCNFKDAHGLALLVDSASNVVYRNNIVDDSGIAKAKPYVNSMFIANAKEISVYNNTFKVINPETLRIAFNKTDVENLWINGNKVISTKK